MGGKHFFSEIPIPFCNVSLFEVRKNIIAVTMRIEDANTLITYQDIVTNNSQSQTYTDQSTTKSVMNSMEYTCTLDF